MADFGNAVAVGASGAAYFTGSTNSNDFPFTSGTARSGTRTDYDAFVAKVTPDAKLAYAVRLGGTASDEGTAIAVDASENVYIAGYTFSWDLPVTNANAPQASFGGSTDGFLAGLTQAGDTWRFVTYLGGAGDERPTGLAADSSGYLYTTGFSTSSAFPTTSGAILRTLMGGMDAFVTKYLTSSGQTPPSVVSGVPASAVASPQTFTFVARDPDGYSDISAIYFLVSGTPSASQNTCHGFYQRSSNTLFLFNDALTAVTTTLPGAAGTLENSQCSVDGGASSVSMAGTDITVQIGLALKGSYATSQKVYLWVVDNEGHGTGWVQTGTWAPVTPSRPPSVISGSPASAAGSTQALTFLARDPDGYADISFVYFLISSTASAAPNTCHGFYQRSTNALFLFNDALNAVTSVIPGVSGTLQNSQCSVDGSTSAVSGAGTDLTMKIGFGLKGAYLSANENVYLWIVDNEGHGTGWVQTGTWSGATASHLPAAVSGMPANPNASPQAVTFVARDLDGYTDISYVYFLIAASPSASANTCHGLYNRSTNTLFLYNDALTAVTSLLPGTTGTLLNSQCSVDGSTSSVSASGTDLTVTIGFGLRGSYLATSRNIYIWVVDNEGHGTGWVQTGTWVRP
jgi:hypothetical protein